MYSCLLPNKYIFLFDQIILNDGLIFTKLSFIEQSWNAYH